MSVEPSISQILNTQWKGIVGSLSPFVGNAIADQLGAIDGLTAAVILVTFVLSVVMFVLMKRSGSSSTQEEQTQYTTPSTSEATSIAETVLPTPEISQTAFTQPIYQTIPPLQKVSSPLRDSGNVLSPAPALVKAEVTGEDKENVENVSKSTPTRRVGKRELTNLSTPSKKQQQQLAPSSPAPAEGRPSRNSKAPSWFSPDGEMVPVVLERKKKVKKEFITEVEPESSSSSSSEEAPTRKKSPSRTKSPARAKSPSRTKSPSRAKSPARAKSPSSRTKSPSSRTKSPARAASPSSRTKSPSSRTKSPSRAKSPKEEGSPKSGRSKSPARRGRSPARAK